MLIFQVLKILWSPTDWLKLFNTHCVGARSGPGVLLRFKGGHPRAHCGSWPQREGAGQDQPWRERCWWAADWLGEAPEQQQCCDWNFRLVVALQLVHFVLPGSGNALCPSSSASRTAISKARRSVKRQRSFWRRKSVIVAWVSGKEMCSEAGSRKEAIYVLSRHKLAESLRPALLLLFLLQTLKHVTCAFFVLRRYSHKKKSFKMNQNVDFGVRPWGRRWEKEGIGQWLLWCLSKYSQPFNSCLGVDVRCF